MTTLLDQAICAGVRGSAHVLVVGIGDEGQGDDGVGPAVVRWLCERPVGAGWMAAVTGTPEQLRTHWGRADLVVMVLAARHYSTKPGSIHALATDLPRGEVGRATSGLGKRLTGLPHRVVVYTVEGANFVAGAKLSAEVEQAGCRLAEHIARQVSILTPGGPALPDQRIGPGGNRAIRMAG